ncbi:hypothetical protein [Rhodococcoides corynebacterioides]|uniref:Uncharacterized protein n=1 Tax=Rhodococcoides corynebacterioides TaxID=53972 RepID=A0ABS7P1S3_9NOCA|nr:hypothetical protein [Rhodococcus corynebacterioides]MBY6365634.1 hypothetical protein [Rhodococcus corynebacterioides]MBY6406365.1 hypothetical protein [Rhodococcus corynebacterioides]
MTDPGCLDCAGSLDHCHGTLVVHSDFTVECTEAGCVLVHRERHALVVDCTAIAGGCACEDVSVARRAS